jgi:hypothetical protein
MRVMLTLLCLFRVLYNINGVNWELSFPTCDARLYCRLLVMLLLCYCDHLDICSLHSEINCGYLQHSTISWSF